MESNRFERLFSYLLGSETRLGEPPGLECVFSPEEIVLGLPKPVIRSVLFHTSIVTGYPRPDKLSGIIVPDSLSRRNTTLFMGAETA